MLGKGVAVDEHSAQPLVGVAGVGGKLGELRDLDDLREGPDEFPRGLGRDLLRCAVEGPCVVYGVESPGLHDAERLLQAEGVRSHCGVGGILDHHLGGPVLQKLAEGKGIGGVGECGEGSLDEVGHDDSGILDVSRVTLDVGRVGNGVTVSVALIRGGDGPGSVDDVGDELDLCVPLQGGVGLVGSPELLGDVGAELLAVQDVLGDLPVPYGNVETPCEIDHVELSSGGGVAEGDAASAVLGVDCAVREHDLLESGSVGEGGLLEVCIQRSVLDPGLMDEDLADLGEKSLDGCDVG